MHDAAVTYLAPHVGEHVYEPDDEVEAVQSEFVAQLDAEVASVHVVRQVPVASSHTQNCAPLQAAAPEYANVQRLLQVAPLR